MRTTEFISPYPDSPIKRICHSDPKASSMPVEAVENDKRCLHRASLSQIDNFSIALGCILDAAGMQGHQIMRDIDGLHCLGFAGSRVDERRDELIERSWSFANEIRALSQA